MKNGRIVIVRVIDRLNVGGPALHAVLTTRGLDATRFKTVLVIGSIEPGEADMAYLLNESGIEYVTLPALGRELRPLRDMLTLWRLYRLFRRQRPDIVHTHKSKAGALGRIAAFLARVPVRVHTYHGHVFHGYFGPIKTRAFLFIERALAKVTSRLIALSSGLVDELSGHYCVAPAGRFSVVRLGFDLEPFAGCERYRGELRAQLGLPSSTKLVGIIGRMVPVKDHDTFIAAAADLAARRDDIHFIFIGGGSGEAQVRQRLDELGLTPRAHLLGWCRQLERLYADLDVVALSSVNEGTPVTLIEAMSAGVPVVATAVGGVPDVLRGGDRGELVPARNPTALSHAIERAFTPTVRQRTSRIRAEVLSEYGVQRLCNDLERIYEELLCGR